MNDFQIPADRLNRFESATTLDGVAPTKLANATLISGKSTPMTRADLVALPPVKTTDTHKPVAHIELIRGIERELGAQGIMIAAEKFSVNRMGNALFGVMDLKNSELVQSDFSAAMGIRTANDKTMSIQLGVGARVFICDNLAFHADMIALKRKHTSGLDLLQSLRDAIGRFVDKFWGLARQFTELKNQVISEAQAKCRIYDVFAEGIVAPQYFPMVNKAYFNAGEIIPAADALVPYDTEFQNTVWALHNAFTWALKSAPMPVQQNATMALARKFSLS